MWCCGIAWFYILLRFITWLIAFCLDDGLIRYMKEYILPGFITRIITSCLDPLHAPLHAPETITCSRIHYIHYRLPNPLHTASVHRCQLTQFDSGPGQRPQRPAGATSARIKPSFFCWIQFSRQYSSVQWLDLPHTGEVAASTRSWHNWSAVQMVVVTGGAWNIHDVTAKYSSNPAKYKDVIR